MVALEWIILIVAAACLVTSLLPIVPSPHGLFRVFEFPRIQSAVISSGFLVLGLLSLPATPANLIAFAMLAAALIIQLYHIARFSPLWRRRSLEYKGEPPDAPRVSILTSNVKQGNRSHEALRRLIEEMNADICVLMETNERWIEALSDTLEDYPFRVEKPLDNGYGMLMVSRLPLAKTEIRFLLNDEVPSFHTVIDHPDGGRFKMIAVHPEPPVIHEKTVGRDAEIALVGKIVRDETLPVIVSGDLNDVAWSSTTRRFVRIGRLLDPREGRGQYNTFDARYFFLRWPLDHIFHSAHFALVEMRRLPFIGSDHFPMFYRLALTDRESGRREVDAATDGDMEQADDLIEQEKQRDHRPIGHDWED